jgi:acyl carrier protein
VEYPKWVSDGKSTPNPDINVDRRAVTIPVMDRKQPQFSSPQTQLEAQLADMWCQVLGLSRVGRDDNFFEIGGHSLFATQIVSRIRGQYQVALPIRELMDAPTVAGLAKAVQTAIWATQVQQETNENGDREELIM